MVVETLFQKELIINNRELKYKGIFRSDELFHVINKAIETRGYEKREKKTEETVAEGGKKVQVELRPFKDKSMYQRLMIKIKVTLDNVTETIEETAGVNRKYDQGSVHIAFDAWSLTEYESRWQMKPLVFFLKSVINKYVYTWPMEAGFKGEVAEDTAYIYAQLKKLLNSYKFEAGKVAPEEEVKRSVEEEIRKEVEESK